ncbi:MAG: hypothetical protein FJ302_05340 [Planctomycetes bacterium]|nr:hypothetical protein [Planctomycetota bacterium]
MNSNRFKPPGGVFGFFGLLGFLYLSGGGCGSQAPLGPPRKPTVAVQGIVHVDGKPVEMLEISCHDATRLDLAESLVVTSYTDSEGKFSLSTYEPGDGVHEGDYVLTFLAGEFNIVSRNYGGPDKLNNRYRAPKESTVKFTAKKGMPVDLGTTQLTTKTK